MTTVVAVRERLEPAAITDLVRSASEGDESAWEQLIAEFGGLVWSVTRTYRLSNADAADVAQTTWTRLVEHLGALTEPSHVGAWLATTARRECARVLRGSRREVLVEDEALERVPTDERVDAELLLAERDQALWSCFARLRATDQALLRLLTADPRPAYEEIAAALDMPIGSIGPTRARALERLRVELERAGATV